MFQKSSLANSLFSKNFSRLPAEIAEITLKQTRKLVAKERKCLNAELKQFYHLYSLLNEKGHLGQLFSRQERCGCIEY